MNASQVLNLDVAYDVPPFRLEAKVHSTSRVISVQGPSGAGKSTLLRILAGVERQAKGVVEVGTAVWQGREKGSFVPPWERGVGWAPQGALLFPHRNVRENLAYAGPPSGRVTEIAGMLEITGLLDRSPSGLSGGERQRVALGRALLSARTLLLLDEPFSALDPDLRQEVSGRVGRWIADAGLPVVMVTHDEEDLGAFAGERWRVVDGRLARLIPGG